MQNNEVKFENRSKNIYELYKLLYCLVRYRKLLSHATVKFVLQGCLIQKEVQGRFFARRKQG